MNKKTIYLPFFTGFYNSIHSFDDEYLIENFIEDCKNGDNAIKKLMSKKDIEIIINNKSNYHDIQDIFDKYYNVDYSKYEFDYSKEYVKQFCELFGAGIEKDLGIKIEGFESLWSPKEYNFNNDEININISYENLDKIKEFLISERVAFSEYIKVKNTSHDGFWAYLENDFNNYLLDLDREAVLTQIIDFYIKNVNEGEFEEGIDFELYQNTKENIYSFDYIKINENINND